MHSGNWNPRALVRRAVCAAALVTWAGWAHADLDFLSAGTVTEPLFPVIAAKAAGPAVTVVPALANVRVVSRKQHGAAGSFELTIDRTQPITGNVTVEPRIASPNHTIVFVFDEPVTSAGSVAATDVVGQPIGSASAVASGQEVVVTLSGIVDNRRVAIALTGVNGTLNASAAIGFLIGDTDSSRNVNIIDISAIRSRAGQATVPGNFLFDVDCSGSINVIDISMLRARSGWVSGTTPPPTVSLAASASAEAGVALPLTATAAAPGGGTLARVEFWADQVKVGTVSAAPYTFNWVPVAEASVVMTAKAIDTNGAATVSNAIGVTIGPNPAAAPARLLAQATFGATMAEINRVKAMTASQYLEEQFLLPQTLHLDTVRNNPLYPGTSYAVMSPSIWKQYFEANDQLRQRVVFALSQIMVVSQTNNTLLDQPCGPAAYLDMLGRNAFGNFRTLLKEVTLAPAMGEYLDMKQSAKADPVINAVPSENYARELLQLFSIGTVMLNNDGSVQFGTDGKPIDTYSEATVQEFARALTGWTFAGQDQTRSNRWIYPDVPYPGDAASAAKACTAWSLPMVPWRTTYRSADDKRNITGGPHDAGAKVLLAYPSAVRQNLPAAQTPEQDLEDVIDNIFNHPNVGPFIGELLIQRLVTSNPSGAYVARVAAAFNDNGSGVRGDMKAVIRAILLDPEARAAASSLPPSFGKLREPVIRFTHLHRAFGAVMQNGDYSSIYDLGASDSLGQSPLRAPSVFNFYSPEFSPTGPLSQNGLYGPEFGITNSATLSGFMDFSKYGILGGFGQGGTDLGKWIRPNYDAYIALAGTPAAMVDQLNILLMSGSMSQQFRTQLIDVATKLTDSNATTQSTERFKTVLWLIMNSPEYSIQK